MLVRNVYPALIDAFRNLFLNLMRTLTLDHISFAYRFSASAPLDAPTKREFLSFPWRLFFPT